MGLPTSITSQLRIPLIAAPMQHVSGPELVAAVCRKGAIGSFPTQNARTPEQLDEWLVRIERACAESDDVSAPCCPNIVMRRSPEALQADIDVLVKHRVRIVLASVGSPEAIIPQLHDVGCTVLTDVATMRHAEKAIKVGADGLVLLTAGAGGQTGWLNGLSFVRAVRSIYDGPVGLAGGLSDGNALWAARVLGCDFGMMGTRFIATHESLAPQGHKQMVVDSGIDDILLTKAINGFDANYLRSSILEVGLDLAELAIPLSVEEARKRFSADLAGTGPKRWADIWSAGHTVSVVSEIQPAGEVVDEIADEYHTAMNETAKLISDLQNVASQ
ncbi:NAD(P)H-dependent flavin oxidoreductase [Allomesorhizobium camelthorni]|uniref:Nitronate monooxygenase n=1 Tax=Allomesorhizobium camelthorni TaxID=475069 RepID=A0A6G4WKD1_9HYPH|nr:nitronate monooxygenase [Mesorhizobium camelthorni]NGO54676.1 nitronate monooxygenase [Mesorhizobium camelthorni]